MDNISRLRQMMAEQKFSDAIKQLESLLMIEKSDRHEFLLMYDEACLRLERKSSAEYLIELIQIEIQKKNYIFAEKLLSNDVLKSNPISEELKIILCDEQGKLLELYNEINRSLLRRVENKNPFYPKWLTSRIDKFFKNDFQFKLINLTSLLHLNDFQSAENLIKEILISSFEKPNLKGVRRNLKATFEILMQTETKAHLEIYQSLCHLSLNGITEKKDYKKLTENLIYFDDFKFQVFLLNLLANLGLREESELYAKSIKNSKDYSFVYLDKYFKNLKKFFHQDTFNDQSVMSTEGGVDQEISNPIPNAEGNEERESEEFSDTHEDTLALSIIKFQDFSFNQLCDLSVGFLQAEVPRVALVAARKALAQVQSDDQFLKVKYLMMSSLLMARDYRAVIDVAFEALGKAENKEDILSFLYGQAEAYMKLKNKEEARHVLSKIVSIDHNYRLAKMRLLKLNEV